MLEIKAHHKELKRAVNEIEKKRKLDRSNKSWYDIRTLKKIKLIAKDKLNATKQNFSLKELTASQTADRHGISNNPSEDHMDNLKRLCDNVLQKVRDHYGKVVSVSSGYRSPELCVKIGSSMKSQHAKGQAADFEIFGIANADLAKYIIDNLDFDQLILEFHKPEEPNSGWIHCSYKNKEENRKQVLRAYRNDDGKTVYEPYDPS